MHNDDVGCAVWIAMVCISVGVGCLTSPGYGFLTFGAILFGLLALYVTASVIVGKRK